MEVDARNDEVFSRHFALTFNRSLATRTTPLALCCSSISIVFRATSTSQKIGYTHYDTAQPSPRYLGCFLHFLVEPFE